MIAPKQRKETPCCCAQREKLQEFYLEFSQCHLFNIPRPNAPWMTENACLKGCHIWEKNFVVTDSCWTIFGCDGALWNYCILTKFRRFNNGWKLRHLPYQLVLNTMKSENLAYCSNEQQRWNYYKGRIGPQHWWCRFRNICWHNISRTAEKWCYLLFPVVLWKRYR